MTDYHIARPEETTLIERITKAIAQPETSAMMFYVWGIGGVGKSTILNRTQEKLAEHYKNKIHFTKFSFGAFTEAPLDVMVKLHKDLPPLGLLQKDLLNKSDPFAEKYKIYTDTLNALESEPIDKGGTVNEEQIKLVKQIGKLALNVGGWAVSTASTMGINTPLSAITSSIASTAISEGVDTAVDGTVTFLSLRDNLLAKHKATQKAEVQELMLEPLPKLTQAFIETLVNHAKQVPIVLILDTYEKASPDVDRWLRELLLQSKDLKNSKVCLLIAGRFQLFKKSEWKDLARESTIVKDTALKVFEKEQIKSYLEKIGVSNKRDIEKLNKITKGLPFYLDLIRKEQEDGEPINFTEEISERLFKDLNEKQKRLLQLAACCRWFDKPLLQSLVVSQDLDFATGVDESVDCFEWLKGYDLTEFVDKSNYRYCLKDVARDVIRQSLCGKESTKFRELHSQLQKYFEGLANKEVLPDLYESEKYENEDWCEYTAEAIYHAFFNLRYKECKLYFLNYFFASRFFDQISIVISPFTAILAEAEVSENNLLHQENQKFLEDLKRLIPLGWLIMTSPPIPKRKVKVNDAVLPKALVETIENGIEKCFDQIDSLSDGVAKCTALMIKVWRCRSTQRLDVLKQAEQQASLLENKINPNAHSNVFYEVANSYISLEKYEEAITSYDKALQIKPDLYDAWNNRGGALGKLGRYEEAIASSDKALQIKSDLHEAWNNRGVALNGLGRHEEAIASYDKALQIKPDFHDAFRGRGISLTRLGQYDKALADFNRAIELEPNDLQSQINRGVLFAWMRQYAEGIEACDGILQTNPNHVDALYGKACCYALQKDIDESIKYLAIAIDQEPDETKKRANKDPEFDGIRDNARFQKLVSR